MLASIQPHQAPLLNHDARAIFSATSCAARADEAPSLLQGELLADVFLRPPCRLKLFSGVCAHGGNSGGNPAGEHHHSVRKILASSGAAP